MDKLTREHIVNIICKYIEGEPRDDIAKDLGLSGSTVSSVTSLIPASLMPLREIFQYFRKIGLAALPLRQLIEKIACAAGSDVQVQQLPVLVEYAIRSGRDANYAPSAVVDAAAKMFKLEAQSGKTYPEALREFADNIAENSSLCADNSKGRAEKEQLKQEILQLGKARVDAERERNLKLQRSRVTEEEIEDVKTLRKQYREDGGQLDGKKLRCHVEFVRRSRCKPEDFDRMASEHRSIDQAIAAVKDERRNEEDKLASASIAAESLRSEADWEQERKRRNKVAADSLQSWGAHLAYVVREEEVYLRELDARIMREMSLYNAIIEEQIRLLGLSPIAAAEYRMQKKVELAGQIVLQDFQAVENEGWKRVKSILGISSGNSGGADANRG